MKAKLIAISGICSAVATGCMLLMGMVPVLKWLLLLTGVLASIAVVIPLLIDGKNLVYSLLIYIASSVLGCVFGVGNIVCVAPIVAFCIPFAIVKVCGESVKVVARVNKEEVFQDPFDEDGEQKVVQLQVNTKRRLNKVVQWVLYYVLLEVGIGLTLLATWLFTPAVFWMVVSSKWSILALVLLQMIVYPYDILMHGCLLGTTKALHKAIKF